MSWPVYVASAHAATGKRTLLVVLAFDDSVAEWASRPIATFHDGTFRPIVLRASSLPRVTDLDTARAQPELAVLSAFAHGRERGAVEVGLAAWVGAVTVASHDADRGKLYADAVLASLTKRDARALLEVVMKTDGYQYKSEWMKQNFAEGEAKGRAEGKAEGKAERLIVRISAERRWPDDA